MFRIYANVRCVVRRGMILYGKVRIWWFKLWHRHAQHCSPEDHALAPWERQRYIARQPSALNICMLVCVRMCVKGLTWVSTTQSATWLLGNRRLRNGFFEYMHVPKNIHAYILTHAYMHTTVPATWLQGNKRLCNGFFRIYMHMHTNTHAHTHTHAYMHTTVPVQILYVWTW
jgi:hypothetical protein